MSRLSAIAIVSPLVAFISDHVLARITQNTESFWVAARVWSPDVVSSDHEMGMFRSPIPGLQRTILAWLAISHGSIKVI